MDRKTRRPRRAAALVLTTAALLTAGTGTALAGGSVPSPTASPTPAAAASATPGTDAQAPAVDGARALCKRAPRVDRRIHRALKRLNAGPARRGSIARLQHRVSNADRAGHEAIRTYLNDRLTFRKSLVPTLHQRQRDLADVRAWCRSHDNGKQAG